MLGNFEINAWLPDGESSAQVTIRSEDIPAGQEDVAPDWTAIRTAMGLSSQTKAQNIMGLIASKILGIP